MSDEDCARDIRKIRSAANRTIADWLTKTHSSVIMTSADTVLCSLASASGSPIASVPLGIAECNGRPYGMVMLAGKGEEEAIFKAMSAWEAAFPHARRAPPRLEAIPSG